MLKPDSSEYDPYYEKYISLITEDDLLTVLEGQSGELAELMDQVPEEERYVRLRRGKMDDQGSDQPSDRRRENVRISNFSYLTR